MAYNALNNLIDAYIYPNGVQAITGSILNNVLKAMVSQLGGGYNLMGVAAPASSPAVNDEPLAYFAATAGTYTNFDGIVLAAGEVAVLLTSGNGSWSKQTIYNVPTDTADLANTAGFITSAVNSLVNYYTKTEIDTTLAGYTTTAALATALADYYNKSSIDAQMAARYTKSEVDSKLGDYYKKTETYDKDEVDSIISALNSQSYIVAWDGSSTPVVANIPAGVSVTYSGTTYTGTLAASASTVNKIYMVWNGVAYDMYGTSQDGGYSWVPMGTTSVDLSQYATKAELEQLRIEEQKKIGSIETEVFLSGDFVPGESQTSRVIVAPQIDEDIDVEFYFSGREITMVRFYADSSYTFLSEYEITGQGQVITFPKDAYSFALFHPAGTGTVYYSFITNSANIQIFGIKKQLAGYDVELENLSESRNKEFGGVSELAISSSDLYKGGVSLSDGSYYDHSDRICTDYIYIGNGLGIDFLAYDLSQSVAHVRMFVVAYKDYYGGRVFSRVISNDVYDGAVCHLHDDEDCVRMYCDFRNSSYQVISNPNISLFNEHIKIYKQEYVRMQQSNIIEVGKCLKLGSDNVAWLLGDYSNMSDKKRTISNYLSVKDGHRYMVTAKSVGMIQAIIFAMFDKDMNETDQTVGYNSGTPIYNTVIDIPKGVKYINVSIVLYQTISDRFNLDDYNVMIYDTTLEGVRFATKEFSYTRSNERYAQGADIYSGYLFQAYSNGSVDVYRLSDKALVQTLNMPTGTGGVTRHLGIIKFGEKYDASDRFGLLWIGGETGVANTIAVRITGEDGSMTVSTIYDLGDNSVTGDVLGFDFNSMKIFRMSYTTQPTPGQYQSDIGYPYIYEYTITAWTSSGSQTLAKTFDINDCYAIQMMQPVGNILYAPVSVGVNAINLFLINRVTEKVEQIIDLTQAAIPVEEPQCVFFNNGEMYFTTVNGLYKVII